MPGRIIQGLRDCGSRNPVILLDEIDKIGGWGHGDPASALLEALDAEQNIRFVDHYVDVPFDLSAALFIATANLMENVPPALRDRMEVIPFPSYTDRERTEIARRYLLPRAMDEHGLTGDQLGVKDDALKALVQEYTRESGVRNLDRQLATVCRKTAREIASGRSSAVAVDSPTLNRFLGPPRFRRVAVRRQEETGTAFALVVSETGGEVMPIEVSLAPRSHGRGEVRLTGNLGDVMKESAQAAWTAVRLALPEHAGREYDVHVHIPEGGIPKEGPSAGLTIACALHSALCETPTRTDTAMTGEITLRGRILPVGGVAEKVLAAHRAGIRRVLLPKENAQDLEEIPDYVRSEVEAIWVDTLSEALRAGLTQ
jgi:ATP-dependent Lon protease